MNIQKVILAPALLLPVLMLIGMNLACAAIGDNFSKMGSIMNTRHNLHMSDTAGTDIVTMKGWMAGYRSDYGEICVYCHTPHGANTTVKLPLWNRTMKATTYTTYDQLGTTGLTQTISQPGIASLGCLSCHDGTTAVDSIVNMPGSGRYSAAQATTQDNAFLNTWPGTTSQHSALNNNPANPRGCFDNCHAGSGMGDMVGNFDGTGLGTDLRDNHPIGITYPSVNGSGTEFKTPAGISGTTRYFDTDLNGKMSKGDIRLYDTGGEAKVECGSCHDAHGVPSAGSGSLFNKVFLRMSNESSGLCYACHSK